MNSLQKQKIPAAVSKRKERGEAKILYHQYSKEKYACRIDLPQICELPQSDNVWIECGSGISRELTDRLGKRFGFNKLILEDAAVVPQPPKLDEYDDSCFLTLNAVGWNEKEHCIEENQMSFLWKKRLLISLSEAANSDLNFLLTRLTDPSSNVRTLGSDYLLFSILNFLIDNAYKTAKSMLDYYDDLEEQLFFSDFNDISKLHAFRKQVTLLSRSLMPLFDILNKICQPEFSFASSKTKKLFANLTNNVTQAVSLTEKLRDSFSFLIDSLDSKNAQSVNRIMKVLTIVSTVFMPLSFIAGVYGMNFDGMPELHWKFGYPFALSLMAAVTLGMIAYFKKKKWW